MSNDIFGALDEMSNKLDILALAFRAQKGCGCGPTSGNVSSEEGTEGDTPPTPFTSTEYGTTEPKYYTRKCKIANRIHEDLVNYVTYLDGINIVSQSIDFMFAVLSAMLSIPSNWPIIGTVAGVISGWLISLQSAISATGVNLSGLITALNNNADDLICALYSSASASDALADYSGVLSTAGVPAIDLALVDVILTYDVLNYLYFRNDGYIEAVLADYTPPVACDCGCVFEWQEYGGSGDLTADSNQRTLTAVYNAGNGRYYIDFGNPSCCLRVQVVSTTATNWTGGEILDCAGDRLWHWSINGGSIVGTWDVTLFDNLSQSATWSMEAIISEIP